MRILKTPHTSYFGDDMLVTFDHSSDKASSPSKVGYQLVTVRYNAFSWSRVFV